MDVCSCPCNPHVEPEHSCSVLLVPGSFVQYLGWLVENKKTGSFRDVSGDDEFG